MKEIYEGFVGCSRNILMLLVGCFGAALCLELDFWVICGYLANMACSFSCTMCVGGCTYNGRCVIIDLGPNLSYLGPNQVNSIEIMFMG